MQKALRWINPLFWFRSFSQFVGYWFVSFPFNKVGPAVPALLGLVAILLTMLLTYSSDSQWRRGLVRQQLRDAKMNRSNDEISLLARRMLAETPDDQSLRFEAAAATADRAIELRKDEPADGSDSVHDGANDVVGDSPSSTPSESPVVSDAEPAVAASSESADPAQAAVEQSLGTGDGAGKSKEQLDRERKLAQGDAAIDDLTRLAIEDGAGQAAVWLLEKQYSPIDWANWDDKKRDRFGKLLEVSAKEYPDNSMVSAVYADYLLIKGQTDQAIREITKLVAFQPARALQGAMLLRQTGRDSQAETMIRRGAEAIKKRGEEEPENVEVALLRAQFALFLKRYQDALELLSRTAKVSEDPRLRSGMAEIFVLWSRDQESVTNLTERFARQLTLLSKATQIAPNHPLVLNDLMTVVLQCADESDPKVAQLRDLLVAGVAPEMAHFIRGTSAMMKNDLETATLHLELAAESLEMVPAVLNNLAVALATRDERDLDRALILVDKAIERSPEQPYFFETRGQILLKLERFQEAITSFEKAMPAKALAVQVHRGLAVAYDALGQAELAQGHERIADAAELAKSGTPEEEKKALDVNFGTRPTAKADPSAVDPPAQEETGGEADGAVGESEADSDR